MLRHRAVILIRVLGFAERFRRVWMRGQASFVDLASLGRGNLIPQRKGFIVRQHTASCTARRTVAIWAVRMTWKCVISRLGHVF